MSKLLVTLLLVFTLPFAGRSQLTSVSPNQLTFGVVNELTTDSQVVFINNNSGKQLTLTDYRFYTTYGSNAFSTGASTIIIPDNSSAFIWVRFHPRHNVYHNSELIIMNDGERGPFRVDLRGQGHYTNAYYDSTENLEEENLKTVLHSITGTGYVSLGYSPGGFPPTCARDSMFMVIDNQAVNGQGAAQNTIECVYTGRQIVGYTDRTQCQNTADPYYNFNTEHTFPQSKFSSQEPMKSDLFHLYPTDNPANNIRADFPFGIVTSPTWTNGGSKFGNGIFEPRDAHKGEVARAMFYFVIRYQNYTSFLDAQEQVLRQWLEQFPVTNVESNRCNHIAGMQHNRNPFIDYPQFIERITSVSNTSVAPVSDQLDFPEDTINYGLTNAAFVAHYRYYVVNKGNQPDTITTYTLSPPANLTFANGTAVPKIVLPGEAAEIDVSLFNATPGNFTGSLVYTVNGAAGTSTVTVPIVAWLSVTGIAETAASGKNSILYPNPVLDEICFNPELPRGSKVRWTDLQGRCILSDLIPENSACYFVPAVLAPGVYVVETIENNIPFHRIVVKQ